MSKLTGKKMFTFNAKKCLSKPIYSILFSLLCFRSIMGGQWLSGRVLDSRPRGRGFEPHWVVVLEQDTFILA